ncbi:MAG: hypothetical protein IJM32_09160 [Ruminococcus sp.]|nr:hypothetical protein [Ruminococcus sp.]
MKQIMNNTLSPLQLAVLMLCARCFSMMTYFPFTGSNALVFMIAIAISAALQGILLIPAAVLCSRRDKGLCEIAFCTSRALGLLVSGAFLLYFIWDIFITTGTFVYFMDSYFSNQIARLPAVICAGGAALYLGGMSSSVLGKCAGIFFCIFAFFAGILVLSAITYPDTANFHLAQRDIPNALANDIKGEFIRNRELVMLVFLLGDVKGSKPKSVVSYLALKLVILEVLLGFAALVLGEFALATDTPFFYLSCLSNSSVVERYDAGFMSVWTVLTVVRLAAVLHCCARCVRLLTGGRVKGAAVYAVQIIPAAATLYLLSKRRWKGLAYLNESPWLLVCAVGLIPLAVMLVKKRRGKVED